MGFGRGSVPGGATGRVIGADGSSAEGPVRLVSNRVFDHISTTEGRARSIISITQCTLENQATQPASERRGIRCSYHEGLDVVI